MRVLSALILCVLAGVVTAGCSAFDRGDETDGTKEQVETTPESVRTAVWERSYSECASYSLVRLARQYNVERRRDAVATAVARAWVRRFNAGEDAISSGRDGCLRGMAEPVGDR